jgi:hypothetical protein
VPGHLVAGVFPLHGPYKGEQSEAKGREQQRNYCYFKVSFFLLPNFAWGHRSTAITAPTYAIPHQEVTGIEHIPWKMVMRVIESSTYRLM